MVDVYFYNVSSIMVVTRTVLSRNVCTFYGLFLLNTLPSGAQACADVAGKEGKTFKHKLFNGFLKKKSCKQFKLYGAPLQVVNILNFSITSSILQANFCSTITWYLHHTIFMQNMIEFSCFICRTNIIFSPSNPALPMHTSMFGQKCPVLIPR